MITRRTAKHESRDLTRRRRGVVVALHIWQENEKHLNLIIVIPPKPSFQLLQHVYNTTDLLHCVRQLLPSEY